MSLSKFESDYFSDTSDEEEFASVLAAWHVLKQNGKKKRRKRRWYVRPINRSRGTEGEFVKLVNEMRSIDHQYYREYFRMSPKVFDMLCDRIRPFITHAPTHERTISVEERLAVTLR